MGFIYLLKFANGKNYIGQTRVSVADRFAQHKHRASRPQQYKLRLYHAWRKYGQPECFMVCEVPVADLNGHEVAAIELFDTLAPSGYNTTKGGDTNPMCSDAARQAIATAKLGTTRAAFSDEWRRNISLAGKGRKFTPEHRARIAAALKGRAHSQEHRAALSAAHSTPEMKASLSARRTGQKHTLETRAKMSAAAKARKPKSGPWPPRSS